MTQTLLRPDELATWNEDGLLLVPDAITGGDLATLQQWVTDLEAMPTPPTGLLQYDEVTPAGESRRCRTENFVPVHAGLGALITTGRIPQIAGELLGEDAVLYKEKVNYKAPGGAGFAPHQDAPAYPYVQSTIACMVAVDDADLDNGCLEIARGSHQRQLATDDRGCIAADVAGELAWEPLPVSAGSLLFFHCFVPHRSGANGTQQTRRAIYLTYNGASEGDLRDDYYAAKVDKLATQPERLSLIGHFTGTAMPVAAASER